MRLSRARRRKARLTFFDARARWRSPVFWVDPGL
jgi:hypothetical protein